MMVMIAADYTSSLLFLGGIMVKEKNEIDRCVERNAATMPRNERTMQDIQLEIIERTQFNNFDGKKIVNSLKANQHLWKGVILTRAISNDVFLSLIPLRDICDNVWNADTLYINTDAKSIESLKKIALKWKADEIHFLSKSDIETMFDAGGRDFKEKVLSVWWD